MAATLGTRETNPIEDCGMMLGLKFGDACRAETNAPARYFGYGKCLYLSAFRKELTAGDALPPTGNEESFPLPTDECLAAAAAAFFVDFHTQIGVLR
jgi:hypothetical protein